MSPSSTTPAAAVDMIGSWLAEVDGVMLDLREEHADVLGVVWYWTGRWTTDGLPLMQSRSGMDRGPEVPLPDVYRGHGPLIPIPHQRTWSGSRAAIGGAA